MRVLIAAPRKSGSARLRCLLSFAYGLTSAHSRGVPNQEDIDAIEAWLGALPESSVVSTDFNYSPEVREACTRHAISLVAILRHPFDLLVSTYDVAQQRALSGKPATRDDEMQSQMVGKSLDDPVVLDYARNEFTGEVASLTGWHESGVPVIRFEQIEADPAAALADLAAYLGVVDNANIARAVALCPAGNPVHGRPERGRRMEALPPGAWQERLPEITLDVLRERFTADVRRLGYEVS